MKTYTRDEIREILPDESISQVNGWLARGDGIAVYENKAFDSSGMGDKRFVSFGSNEAMFHVPPDQLPDMMGEINWKFQLDGVFRRRVELPAEKVEHNWATPAVVAGTFHEQFVEDRFDSPRDRVMNYGFTVRRIFDRSDDFPEGVDWFVAFVELANPSVHIELSAKIKTRGIDRLGDFLWTIKRGDGVELDDLAENMGAAMVATYNKGVLGRDD